MTRNLRNIAASARVRLRNQARATQVDSVALTTRYVLERLLYRMSVSPYAGRFVLKGAMLFPAWTEYYIRPTRDLDLCTDDDQPPTNLDAEFREILSASVEDDGVKFDVNTLKVMPIREDASEAGMRVNLLATLDTTCVKVQVDVGFGDVITPEPEYIEYPSLLEFPKPHLRTCPRYTSVAEKLHAMAQMGIDSTRLKDFFDLAAMSRLFEFDGTKLTQAIVNSFGQRGTEIPSGTPAALTQEYADKPSSINLWAKLTASPTVLLHGEKLMDVLDEVGRFILPPACAAAGGHTFEQHWPAGGPWVDEPSAPSSGVE